MRFSVVTIFPELFDSFLATSLIGKAIAAGRVAVERFDPRAHTSDRHRTVDDAPYGGGPGMVMKPEPLVAAVEEAEARGREAGAKRVRRVFLTPAGRPLTQEVVSELSREQHLVLLCGRYEGVDERVAEEVIDDEISLGDFVMTGGELAAMAVIDAVSRYVPGVLGEAASVAEESFSEPLLEYPHYTRPQVFRGRWVPDALRSGDHARIRRWRRAQALARTAARRPDLLAARSLSAEDRELLGAAAPVAWAERTFIILAHHPVIDRVGEIVTTSVTNLDIHDIARSAATYGLGGYFPVSPIAAQREKVEHILAAWAGQAAREGAADDHRAAALDLVQATESIEAALAAIAGRCGQRPRVVVTSADRGAGPGAPLVDFSELRAQSLARSEPLALVFGTGFGLAEAALRAADARLAPIAGVPAFNHLSVRSAVAIVLDRLFGLR
jgi:tRNA (guanine37-N1)-methyltransferase